VTDRVDVAIVGAGHNALVAACYLARAGLDVEVLERDTVVGGAVSTVERFPGHRVDRGSSLHVMVRHTDLVEDLELGDCGLRYLDADPWGYVPAGGPDSPGLAMWTDLDRTVDAIAAAFGPDDARGYRELMDRLIPVARGLFATFTAAPTPARIMRAGPRLRPTDNRTETVRWFLQPADHLLDAHLRDERLKSALAWLVSQSGPPSHEPGTVGHLMWVALMHLRAPGRPVGGSGQLSAALAERLRRLGGRLSLGDGATAVLATDGKVTGVRTAGGREVRARAVLSGAHVLTTLDLLAAAGLEPPTARARVRVGDGIGVAVRVATDALPAYRDAPSSGTDHLRGMQLLVTDRSQLRAAYADYLVGRPPQSPAVLALTPTAADPSLAPPGEHQATLWAQWHRFDLADGRSWDGLREKVAESCIAAVDAHAPGFAESVRATHVQTPSDLASELGLHRGNVMHVEMALDAMFGMRPLPEFARYRTPVPGLYLTGASTHPGGGVFGASGRNAARAVLADLRRRGRAKL
jgi:phytoene dehydrogenase-like protein